MVNSRPLTSFTRLLLRPQSRSLTITPLRLAGRNPSDQRDAQDDREKMNTEPNEYAKSGTDAGTAHENAAFDTNNPKPEDAKAKAGKGNDVNPLDASPANQTISQHTSESSGGAGKKMSEGGGGRQGGGDSTGDKHGGSST